MTLLSELLTAFQKSGSSDLHLTEGSFPHIRKHGRLTVLPGATIISSADIEDLTKELVGMNKYEKFLRENELDVGADYGIDRIRINLYRQKGKIAWALRLLPSRLFPLEQLGIPLPVLQTICSMQKGLVLISGATGSGKSTTLASLIHEINATRHCHIFTIEDPIEFIHENIKSFVSQREIGTDTSSYEEALRRVLREDPDVVVIGEMRDQSTMRAALTLAETGHLTFGTLHTSDAVQTITRIIGSFPPNEQEQIRVQLASVLNLVICQHLVPWSNGLGRSLAAELLVATSAVKAMIRENKIHQIPSSIQTGQQYGMRTMNFALAELLNRNLIDANTAELWSPDREGMKRIIAAGPFDSLRQHGVFEIE